MEYTTDDIRQHWLTSGAIPYSEEQTVEAFNEVQSTLGNNWITNIKFHNGCEQFGALPTLSVVMLGLKLKTLKKGVNYQSLITKLRSPDTVKTEKAIAELNAIYLFCHGESDVEFELEPKVNRLGKTSSFPDFRIKKTNDVIWTYIEVKQPDRSHYNKAALAIIKKIQNIFAFVYELITLEIILYRIPTEDEIGLIFDSCLRLVEQQNEPQCMLQNLGIIKINHTNPNDFKISKPTGLEDKNMYVIVAKSQTQNAASLVCVSIVTSDERVIKFFSDGPDQLEENSPGIVFIDGNNIPGALKVWPKLIEEEFEHVQELGKSISAFILYTCAIENLNGFENQIFRSCIICNNNANHKTPQWILDRF